jgi:suppressor for copper-sensitivity B
MMKTREILVFWRTAVLVSLAVIFGPACVFAAASDWSRTDVTQVRLIAARTAVGEAAEVRAGLQFQLEPGWKIYWRSPGDSGSPPKPDFSRSKNVADVEMRWPAPQRFFELADLQTIGYLDEAVFPLTVRVERPGEPVSLRATVDYQACEKICIPFSAELSLELPAGEAMPTGFSQLIERYEERVPRDGGLAGIEVLSAGVIGAAGAQFVEVALKSPVAFGASEMFVEAPIEFRIPAGETSLAANGTELTLRAPVEARGDRDLTGERITITVVSGDRSIEIPITAGLVAPGARAAAPVSLLLMLAIALLGGLILNLMPCVLPVLSLKLLGAIGHGGGERRQVSLSFVAAAAGIVTSFLVLAAGAVAVKLAGGAVGWGIQFQQPLFLVFLILVLSLFAYNLFGLYEVGLPGWLGDVGLHTGEEAVASGGVAGHFITGAFATLLATPCSAPFLGTAVGFALSRGSFEIFAIFAALGVGMSMPYLAVAVFPGLATRLPRPGRWMLWLRTLMGVALAGTAVWLITVLAAGSGMVAAVTVAGLMVLIVPLIWLMRSGRARRSAGLASLAVLAVATFAAPLVLETRPNVSAASDVDMATALEWHDFDLAAIDQAVAAGKLVFVDVTADWCVTCKVNKRLVLDNAPVRDRLLADDVICMRADWTRPSNSIAAYLASFGRYGIPFNAVYGPGARDGLVLSELLSAVSVLSAIETAG